MFRNIPARHNSIMARLAVSVQDHFAFLPHHCRRLDFEHAYSYEGSSNEFESFGPRVDITSCDSISAIIQSLHQRHPSDGSSYVAYHDDIPSLGQCGCILSCLESESLIVHLDGGDCSSVHRHKLPMVSLRVYESSSPCTADRCAPLFPPMALRRCLS